MFQHLTWIVGYTCLISVLLNRTSNCLLGLQVLMRFATGCFKAPRRAWLKPQSVQDSSTSGNRPTSSFDDMTLC